MVERTYKCKNCGQFDKLESIKDGPLKNCPNCGEELKRKFYNTDVLFCEVNKGRFDPINPQKNDPMLTR